MKALIVNKSDTVGGAAVVSRRLAEALRQAGVQTSMLVVDRQTDSPDVHLAAGKWKAKIPFLAECLKIFLQNGRNRDLLFKVDTASDGLPLHRHPLVREADVVLLNWVNQGFLSLREVERLLQTGKKVVWTMHDMWNFTGICHHAGSCRRWLHGCGECPLLGSGAGARDASSRVWNDKQRVYASGSGIHFVAVSNWLARQARTSPLLADASISVIPNAFPIPADAAELRRRADARRSDGKFRIVMGAARLDDTVKGFPILVEATGLLRQSNPELAERMELVTFGNFKNEQSARGIAIPHRHLGVIRGEENVRNVYLEADAVVSTSLYETLPGTLVEGQVYGALPVSFGRGGQSDIVDHLQTGYIAPWSDDTSEAARNIADGLLWAMARAGSLQAAEIRARMLDSATRRFSAPAVAAQYLSLINTLTNQ